MNFYSQLDKQFRKLEGNIYKQNLLKIDMHKRGQGLSTNAIILIVLGVIVLTILVMGFTVGWSKIAPWITTDNVDAVVQQCSIACSTSSIYSFCSLERMLKADDLPGGEGAGNCTFFATNPDYQKYRVAECAGLC